MASRLRIAKPAGSKLTRPVGSGMRVPGGGGPGKTSPQPYESPKPARQPLPSKKQAGVVQQGKPVRSPAIKPATEIPTSATANGGDGSLEVGDRVLVNGKQGVLAFLGETQFARGEWGGVILDSLEGKNNGSVNGVQYFECEPNKGLFSKLEKIKLVSKVTDSHPPPPAPSEQFRVGDQVLVDGQKQGTIGFLGVTQFARGVWAGVVMEGPGGKNDGTVAGIKYFDCEPYHGLFTRPQKLRLVSKSGSQPPKTPENVHFQDQEEGQRSAQPTPTELKQLHNQLKIGDQVLVGGIKEGILRYLGPTEFAKGVWVGVELPEPMGKNDGAVSGKRFVFY